jgi:hypothetical protein
LLGQHLNNDDIITTRSRIPFSPDDTFSMTSGDKMINEDERIWKVALMTRSKVWSQYLAKGAEENHDMPHSG